MRPRHSALLLLALTALAWAGSLFPALLGSSDLSMGSPSIGFAFDDAEAILENPVVQGSQPWSQAFLQDYWQHRGAAGHWRPGALLSLRLDNHLWNPAQTSPLDTRGFHLTNLLLHLAVVLSAWAWLSRYRHEHRHGQQQRFFEWGLCFFALHPVLTDSVAWISGRTSMLSALGGLLGALLLQRILERQNASSDDSNHKQPAGWNHSFLIICAALGLFAALCGKEDGVFFAPLYLLMAYSNGSKPVAQRNTLAVSLGCAIGLGAALYLRHLALGPAWLSAPHAPLAKLELGQRMALGGRGFLELLRLLVFPFHYPPNYAGVVWTQAQTSAAPSLLALGWFGCITWMGLLSTGLFGMFSRRRPVGSKEVPGPVHTIGAASLFLASLAWLPHSQWIPSGEVFAPRFAYLPLLFAVPCVSTIWSHLTTRFSTQQASVQHMPARSLPIPSILSGVLVLSFVALAWQRARVYDNRTSYRIATLEHTPQDVRSWNDLGIAYQETEQLESARSAWVRATEIDPRYSRAWSNLGQLEWQAGRLDLAEPYLRRAVQEGPLNLIAHCNLAKLCLESERTQEALELYSTAVKLAPGFSAAQRGLARSLWQLGQKEEARAVAARALELDPSDKLARELVRQYGP